jgi:diacylglycerol O-acyltransferase / wax synthase
LRGAGAVPQPPDLPAPRTRFNEPVSPQRVVDGVRFPLADIERMQGRVHGATVDDVAIAIIGGALWRYLDAHLEAPTASLVAEVPLGRRTDARGAPARTFADSAVMPIFTDIEDPAERLTRIVAAREQLRADHAASVGRRLVVDLAQFLPTPVLGAAGELAQSMRLGSRVAPIANASIASVRGPEIPLYFAGAPLVAYYGFSVIHDLAGIAHVIGQYHGAVTIGVTACRAMLPDPDRYETLLRRSYDELATALGLAVGREPVGIVETREGERGRPPRVGRARKDVAVAG